jgi:hypothetical protein
MNRGAWKVGAAAFVGAGALFALATSPSFASDRAYPEITVTSQSDPWKTISAPVRRLPQGDQVRLPGGAWVWCGINCFHTLRNATIDFWQRYDAPGGQ